MFEIDPDQPTRGCQSRFAAKSQCGLELMLGLQNRHQLSTKLTLFELITKKNIDDLSSLRAPGDSLGLPDLIEDIDEFSPSSEPFVFSRPIDYLHSSVRTIRRMAPSKSNEKDGDKQGGSIFSISGPVIVAENMIGCAMHELCKVGYDSLVGEVIRIEADKATIQVYEETGM